MKTKKALEAKRKLTPESGYNVVGVEEYGDEDDQGLYLVGHFEDEAAATAEKARRESVNPDSRYYVYGPRK